MRGLFVVFASLLVLLLSAHAHAQGGPPAMEVIIVQPETFVFHQDVIRADQTTTEVSSDFTLPTDAVLRTVLINQTEFRTNRPCDIRVERDTDSVTEQIMAATYVPQVGDIAQNSGGTKTFELGSGLKFQTGDVVRLIVNAAGTDASIGCSVEAFYYFDVIGP